MRLFRGLALGVWAGAWLAVTTALVSCFPDYGVGPASDGGADQSSDRDTSSEASADATIDQSGDGPSEASDDSSLDSGSEARSDASLPFDGGSLTPVPSCGDMSGLQPNAPWPMHGYCPTQRRRSPLPGPGMTKPAVQWSKKVQPDSSFSPLVSANGKVIVVSTPFSTNNMGSAMTAFDLGGNHKWTWTPPAGDDIQWAPAIGADDVIYVPCTNYVYGIGLDGNQRWRSRSNNGTRSPLVVGPGPMLYVTDPGSALWSLASDGGDNWTASIPPGADYQTPMFGVLDAGPTIYLTANDTSLWTVTPAGTSTRLWPGDDAGGNTTLRAIAAPDGNIRISNETDARLYSLKPTGAVAWSWPASDAAAPGTPRIPAVGDDSTTFIGHAQGEVVAIDANGQQRWTTAGSTDPAPLCNAMTLDSNGVVYTGCDQGLHAYDRMSGVRYWEMNPNQGSGTGYDYGISIGWNGVLYVSCSDGYVYAIGP